MRWTSYLPNSPDTLSRLEWWLWIIAAGITIVGVLIGVAAREVGRHKANTLEQGLAKVLQERDAKTRELEQMATEAKQEVTTAMERQQPRRLTPDQQSKLLARLSSEKGIAITVVAALSPEASNYAEQFAAILKEAGWLVSREDRPRKGKAVGIAVLIRDAAQRPSAAELLVTALKTVGLPVVYSTADFVTAGSIELAIGHKPQ